MTGPRPLVVAEQLRRRVPGGIGTYVSSLTGALVAAGTEVTLWASRPPRGRSPGAPPPDRVAALGTTRVTSALPSRALVAAWDRGWAGPPPGFDVVHATSLAVPPAGRAPMTVMVHDLAWRRAPETFPERGRRWHEAALGRALARAALLLTPSRLTADDLVLAGAPASKVEVVEEGCDHLPPPDHAGADALRAALGIEEDYLLTVSTIEPRKNLERLVAAYGQARARLPHPAQLVVVGPAGWGGDLSPRPGVVMAGHVEEPAVLAGLYVRARLVVSVPLVEGFGLPAVEPMALGTPVVASPQPSTGGAAYEVDPHDVGSIADGLTRVATDEALRADLVAAGRERAARLTWSAAADHHRQLWADLASTGPTGPAGPPAGRRRSSAGD